MGKVLIIGAGGVGTVVAHKVAQNPDVFTDIMIASRTKSKCDAIVKAIGNPAIKTAQVDADNVDELVELFNSFKPEIVINVALPYQDLTIMEACLKAGVNYLAKNKKIVKFVPASGAASRMFKNLYEFLSADYKEPMNAFEKKFFIIFLISGRIF